MVRRPALAGAIAGISFATGLFFLTALRWLAFFGPPPMTWAAILLTGVPLGGFIGMRVSWLRSRTLASILLVSAGLILLGTVLFLLGMFWINAPVDNLDAAVSVLQASLLTRSLAATCLLFPSMIACGMAEFASFRAGLAGLNGNSSLVYAMNLTGLLLAYVGYRLLLVPLGTTGLLTLGLFLLCASSFAVAPRRWLVLAAAAAFASYCFVPALETAVTSALAPKAGPDSLGYWRQRDNPPLHDAWTPHMLFTVARYRSATLGLYDGVIYWAYLHDLPDPRASRASYAAPGRFFALLVRSDDQVAVLGAGSAVQVASALRAGARRVFAVNAFPHVTELLSGALSESLDNTFKNPSLEPIMKNPRKFLEDSEESFDIIVISSMRTHVGGIREILDPSQNLFTREAFATMDSRLAPGGVVIINSHTFIDNRGTIFSQSLKELTRLGFRTRTYLQTPARSEPILAEPGELMARGFQYLIVAQKKGNRSDALATTDNIFRNTTVTRVEVTPSAMASLPGITDDGMLAAGTFLSNLDLSLFLLGSGAIAVLLVVFGLLLWWLLGRFRTARSSVKTTFWSRLAPPLVGFNVTLLTALLVYRCMDHLDTSLDATFLGTAVFAVLAAAGSLLLTKAASRTIIVAAGILAVLLLTSGVLLPQGSLALILPAIILTGTFFPRILKGTDEKLIMVYTWETYGIAWGALATLFVPVIGGFSGLQVITGLALFFAAWTVARTSGESP